VRIHFLAEVGILTGLSPIADINPSKSHTSEQHNFQVAYLQKDTNIQTDKKIDENRPERKNLPFP
jgi:hypothetical protein